MEKREGPWLEAIRKRDSQHLPWGGAILNSLNVSSAGAERRVCDTFDLGRVYYYLRAYSKLSARLTQFQLFCLSNSQALSTEWILNDLILNELALCAESC